MKKRGKRESDELESDRLDSEEKYRFIQEQIRPQRKSEAVRFVRRAVEVCALAVMFGAVAGVTFDAVCDYTKGYSNAKEPEKTKKSGDTVTEGEDDELTSEDLASLEGYQGFWKKASVVGKQCNRTIVSVCKKQKEGTASRSMSRDNAQSGMIIQETDEDLAILTFDDKLSDAKSAKVQFASGQSVDAKVKARDSVLGLVLLSVKKEELSRETKRKYAVAKMDDTSKIGLNEPVVAFGAPDDVLYSVMPGHVTNNKLTDSVADDEVCLYNTNLVYCPDADGFVANLKGEWLGIITNGFLDVTGENNCSFLGVSTIYPRIIHLLHGDEIPYMGVVGWEITDDEKEDDEISDSGIYVTGMNYQSPACRAGLRAADVITAIENVNVKGWKDIRDCLLQCEAGDHVTLRIKRDCNGKAQSKEIEVVLE